MRAIDADYLIKRLDKCDPMNGIGLEPVMAIRDVKLLISVMPKVDAAPVKHGRWLPVLNCIDDDTNPAFDCSECDAMYNKKHNYCPACGAKMDLEEQHEQIEQPGK